MPAIFELNFAAISDVGRNRKNNEDYTTFFIPANQKELKNNGSLFIVADGVGGASKGEVASKYAADTVLFEYYNSSDLTPVERLVRAMKKANHDIYLHSQENGNFMHMATTMVAALVLQNNLIIAHVGDSRLYVIRGGKIKQFTRDHSVVAEMVRNGEMTEEEARTSKAKNRITRSIGGDPEVHVDVSNPIPMNLGDRVLICSDGLTRYLDSEDLLATASKGDVEAIAKNLIKLANNRGGADNVSVILLETVTKAKSKMKKPIKRKTQPEHLGWDEMETQYPTHPPIKQRKIPRWAFIAAAALVVVVVSVFLLLISKKTEKSINLPPTEAQFESSFSTETHSVQMPDTGPIPVGTDTEFPPPTVTPEVVNDSKTSGSETTGAWQCVHKVNQGDQLFDILESYGQRTDRKEHHYYPVDKCYENQEPFICEDIQSYPNINDIDIGEWIVVYSSDKDEFTFSRPDCMEKGGRVFNNSSTGGNE
jgi:protein phosphatase